MSVEPLAAPSAPEPLGPYAAAVRAGDWVVCSGQIGIDPLTGGLVVGGIEEQTEQVLVNVSAVLGDCGVSWSDVAKVTIFLTDLGNFPVVNRLYEGMLGGHRPARSTIGVAALPAGAAVELEVWAHAPAEDQKGTS